MDRGAWRAVVHGVARVGQEVMPSTRVNCAAPKKQREEVCCAQSSIGLSLPSVRRPSATTRVRFTELSKLVGGKGIPPSITPRNLSIHDLWDGKRGTQHCHFSKSHNRRDNQRVFDDIQISSACYHLPQH